MDRPRRLYATYPSLQDFFDFLGDQPIGCPQKKLGPHSQEGTSEFTFQVSLSNGTGLRLVALVGVSFAVLKG
jgi:hypothetical protein